MAVLIQGLQGSGKSYYATYKMLHDGYKYHRIFTNIDGIKTTDKIKPLAFKEFTNDILIDCYNMQVGEDRSFDEVIEFLQEKEILPENVSKDNRVLLVVDEAQNYFGKSVKLSPALVWFVTQHRHLYIELYLITQKYILLRDDYKLFNLVYQAYPPVKQFNSKKIKYAEYAGLPLSNDNLSKTFTLPKEQEVFDLYVSGDKVDSPNVLKRFIWIGLGLIVFLFAIGYYFISTFTSDDTVDEKVNRMIESPKQVSKYIGDEGLTKDLYTFVIWDDGYFYVRDLNEGNEYPIKLLTYIKDRYFLTVVEKIKMSEYHTMLYVVCDSKMSNFLKHEEESKVKTPSSFLPSI